MKGLTARILSLIMAVCLLMTAFAEMPDNSWACPSCGNTNAKAFCTNCGLKRPEAWTCIACGEVNEADSRECRACGRNISGEWSCAMCGAVNIKDNKFCGQCGSAIGTKPEAPEAEVSYNWDDFEFETLDDGTLCLMKYKGSDAELIIPGKRDGVAVTGIGEGAFSNCNSLTSVTIPDSVKQMGADPFGGCVSLTTISVSPTNTVFKTIDGVLFNKQSKTLIYYPKTKQQTSYAIPDGVESIGEEAFSYCDSLTSVTIPDSVTSIGDFAFFSCDGLTSVTIPDSVTSIGLQALSYCSSLTSVTIADGVTSIGDAVFYSCGNLTSVTIPDSVTSIGDYAFDSCDSLTSVTLPDSVKQMGANPFGSCASLTTIDVSSTNTVFETIDGVLFNKQSKTLICYPITKEHTSYAIPDGVESIGEGSFSSCGSLVSVMIPDSVTSIGDYAFCYCGSLVSVTISDSVTSIGWGAFDNCSSLTGVTIPDGVTSIGGYAFHDCPNLTITATPGSYAEKYAKENNIPVSAAESYTVTIKDMGVNGDAENVLYTVTGEYGTAIEYPETVKLPEEPEGYKVSWSATMPETIPGADTEISVVYTAGNYIIYQDENGEEIYPYAMDYAKGFASYEYLLVASGYSDMDEEATSEFLASYDVDAKGAEYYESLYNKAVEDNDFNSLRQFVAAGSSITAATVPAREGYVGSWEPALPEIMGSEALTVKVVYTEASTVAIGSYVTFGAYPQTAEGTDSTPIEWLVLDVQDNKALLISRYGLDAQPYNTDIVNDTWEECTLRAWLNDAFLNRAFSAEEQHSILTTAVDNSRSQCYSDWYTSGGNDTQDRIFLLSCAEANKYFGVTWTDTNNTKSRVEPTAYAIKNGAYTSSSYTTVDGKAAGYWWLRSPGHDASSAARVYTDGSLRYNYIDRASGVVRPAFWINLEAKASGEAEEVSYNWDDFEFETLADGTLCLTKYKGSDAELIIPGKRDGVAVTGIGGWAFSNCNSLTSVTIPDSVKQMGKNPFECCVSLTTIDVSLTNTVFETIDGVLFNKQSKTLICYPKAKQQTSYAIPDGVESIGEEAFYNCNSLTSVTIPDSVTSIGRYVFCACDSLTSVTIPVSVTSIGDHAFAWCVSLKSVAIPDSVKQMGENPFRGCASLTTIDVSTTNTVFETIDGVLFNKQSKTLICYPVTKKQTSYTIPDGVESIGEMAFYNCFSLTSVTIPDSVTSIGDAAFYNCNSLTSVTIPDSVTSIGTWAFGDCDSLTSVTIPDSVTSIDDSAFSGCPNLTITATPGSYAEQYANENGVPVSAPITLEASYNWDDFEFETLEDGTLCLTKYKGSDAELIIPGKRDGVAVTGIGEEAFDDCSSLTSVTIPDGVTGIGDFAFYDCVNLTSVTIPDSVTGIGDFAFGFCESLMSITIPDSVTDIAEYAFYGCSSLTSVTIPDSVTSIGDYAFAYCDSMTSVTIRGGLQKMGANPFSSCSSLSTINVSQTNTVFETVDGVLFNKQSKTLICYPMTKTETSYVIPDGVKLIGDEAFYYCSRLTSITIPDSVTGIGEEAFYYCSSLTSITIPDSVTSIGGGTFGYCHSLTSVAIPDSLLEMGRNPFQYCESLTTIDISPTHTVFEIIDDVLFNKQSKMLIYYPVNKEETSYVVPDGVKSIGDMAFWCCDNLTSVTVPDSVTRIDRNAFTFCPNLTITATPGSYAEKYAKENNIPVSAPARTIEVGSYVTFGTYPQTAKGEDKTPVEWIVLDVKDGDAYVMSRYALDVRQFNTTGGVTWENSGIRAWLNGAFLIKAFTADEKKAIKKTSVDGGASSYVFLLSRDEYSKLPMDLRGCMPTAYACSKSEYVSEGDTCYWWMRTT